MATPLFSEIALRKPLLRVGVMLDDWTVPAWVAEVMASIQHSRVALLTAVILNREDPTVRDAERTSLGAGRWQRYAERDRQRHPQFAAPFEPIDIQARFASVQTLEAAPLRIGALHRFNAADLAAIRQADLDVIVQLGFATLIGDILAAARHGVWAYGHGGGNTARSGPAAFWEMYDQSTLIGATLTLQTEENGGGKVLYRSFGATQSYESLAENRYWLYRKAIPFAARCLRRLYEHGPEALTASAPSCPDRPAHAGAPGSHHMLRFFARVQRRHLVVRLQDRLKIRRDYWSLAVAQGGAPGTSLVGKVAPLQAPRGHFWADPLLVRHAGQLWLFFEDYDFAVRRAHISVAEVDGQGRLGEPRVALRTEHHLSYPFVFQWRGDYFMIPESASVNSVQLYRAREFPSRWDYVQDLLSGVKAVDATVHEHHGLWYLFAGVSESGGSTCDELFLFMAETPLGPWLPHPMNPIVSDVRCARPGGALFRQQGLLYRPAQNCARTYGHALAIMQVMELSPERYAEQHAYTIEPDWLPGIYGCHTITMADDMMVLDCKSLKWRA